MPDPFPTLTHHPHNPPQKQQEDRGFVIDAAIVRVAKARRLISHNELLAEVTQQIALFKAQPPQIKKRIAGLIEKVCVCVCWICCIYSHDFTHTYT